MSDFDPNKTPGSFGAPPPEAPREVAQPLDPSLLSAQLAKARANERELAPFAPEQTRMGVPPPTTIHAPERSQPANPMPAASDTDSPSRGMPTAIADPGKRITGGFGPAMDAQYFPIDGAELKELVLAQFDALAARIQNDLRFHLAVTYPRIRCRVAVEVEAYAQEFGPAIEVIKEVGKTPLEVAKRYADQVAFVLVEQRQEFAEDGASEHPPNFIREELKLPIPHKRQIEVPGGRMFVDTVPDTDGLF